MIRRLRFHNHLYSTRHTYVEYGDWFLSCHILIMHDYYCKKGKQLYYGTIPILRQHLFGLFLTHPPYVSINLKVSKKLSFFWLHPPQSLCWRNIGMVPITYIFCTFCHRLHYTVCNLDSLHNWWLYLISLIRLWISNWFSRKNI